MDFTKKEQKDIPEFNYDWSIYKGKDACPTCAGCGSIFIFSSDGLVDHCDTCPTCLGHGSIRRKNLKEKRKNYKKFK